MLALMKTRHTDLATEIFVSLPPSIGADINKFIQDKLKALGHTVRNMDEDGEELFTIEEVFPNAKPGMVLRGFRNMEDMTQMDLAEKLGIHQHRVSEMESGKRPISIKMARKLSEIFETSYKSFM